MRLRALLYAKGFLQHYTLSVPTISVGNLIMGGSGKTPMVIYLSKLLLDHGLKPAVVSRGYGGKASGMINIVSDGKDILLDSKEAGDEPRLIAETLYGVPVLTGKKRIHPCRYAIENFDCDVIILDDGFQHLSLTRNIDLVLFTATSNLDLMHVLPGGVLREPFSALKRADVLLITGCSATNTAQAEQIGTFLQKRVDKTPLFQTSYSPSHLRDIAGNENPLPKRNSRVMAFCGIASPARFKDTLDSLSLNVVDFRSFTDHHPYDEETIQSLIVAAKEKEAECIVTTEKDLVKIKEFSLNYPIHAVCMEVIVPSTFDTFFLKAVHAANSTSALS